MAYSDFTIKKSPSRFSSGNSGAIRLICSRRARAD